jgi:FlaA1/EpsC-like NDP-sugar epimerase
MKIKDLLEIFCEKFNKSYILIGIRPGEKIHEVMLSLEEMMKASEWNNYFIIKNKNIKESAKEYSSADFVMKYDDLKSYILNFLNEMYKI